MEKQWKHSANTDTPNVKTENTSVIKNYVICIVNIIWGFINVVNSSCRQLLYEIIYQQMLAYETLKITFYLRRYFAKSRNFSQVYLKFIYY